MSSRVTPPNDTPISQDQDSSPPSAPPTSEIDATVDPSCPSFGSTRSHESPDQLEMLAIAATASSASEALPNRPSSSTSCIECTRLAFAPTVHVIRPHADLASIRSAISETLTSLRTIEDALSCESDFQQLQEEHEALQHTHVNARRHTHDLHRQLDQMMSEMEPFAHFCQDRYNQLARDLELSNTFLVEKKPAVDELESDLSQLREEYDYLQKTSDASILHLQVESNVLRRQNDDLRSQLQAVTAHPDVGPAPLPALARRLRAQDQELAAVKQRFQVLEQSGESLESAVSQLRHQMGARDRRLARVQEERDQFQAQLPGLQDERRRAIAATTSALERLDKSRADIQAQGGHVSSMRGTISRLEQKIADLQASQSQFQSDLASRNQEQVTLHADHAAISSHYRDVYDRFRAVARLLSQDVALPSSLISSRPEPISPAGRAQKASRINPPLASSSTPTSVQISRSHDTVTPTITPPSDLGSNNPSEVPPAEPEDDPFEVNANDLQIVADQAKSRATQSHESDRGGPAEFLFDLDHNDLEGPSEKSLNYPIAISPDNSSLAVHPAPSDRGSPAEVANRNAGSTLIPANPTVPRSEWIPGLYQPRLFRSSDVFPWDSDLVSHLQVSALNVRVLSDLLVNVSDWLFPDSERSTRPTQEEIEDMFTGDSIDTLMTSVPPPWAVMVSDEAPLTFMADYMSPGFCEKYLEYEEKHLQAIWESGHFFPISDDMCTADIRLSAYQESRRQRRSRAGVAWKQFLERHVLPALRSRRCDLDILLDPFFLHFPKSRRPKIWYPDLPEGGTLADALLATDLAEPWRIQYRQSPNDHPAVQIPRLWDKFVSGASSSAHANTEIL